MFFTRGKGRQGKRSHSFFGCVPGRWALSCHHRFWYLFEPTKWLIIPSVSSAWGGWVKTLHMSVGCSSKNQLNNKKKHVVSYAKRHFLLQVYMGESAIKAHMKTRKHQKREASARNTPSIASFSRQYWSNRPTVNHLPSSNSIAEPEGQIGDSNACHIVIDLSY